MLYIIQIRFPVEQPVFWLRATESCVLCLWLLLVYCETQFQCGPSGVSESGWGRYGWGSCTSHNQVDYHWLCVVSLLYRDLRQRDWGRDCVSLRLLLKHAHHMRLLFVTQLLVNMYIYETLSYLVLQSSPVASNH